MVGGGGLVLNCADLCARLGDELVLARPSLDDRLPRVQVAPQVGDVAGDVVEDAEVDQRHPARLTSFHLVERALPCLDVEVGRGTRRSNVAAGLDAHAGGVAGEEGAVAVDVADVVGRMAGRGERVQAEHAFADDLDVLLRDGREFPPQLVERLAVEPPGAPLEPGGIDEVRRADLRHVHAEPGVAAHEDARGARMVEVDVREEQVADVGQGETALVEPLLERAEAARRAAVEERGPVVRLEQVHAYHALLPLEAEVKWRRDRHARTAASAPTIAWARSSIRSSADSIPAERRTRFAGAANGASAVD